MTLPERRGARGAPRDTSASPRSLDRSAELRRGALASAPICRRSGRAERPGGRSAAAPPPLRRSRRRRWRPRARSRRRGARGTTRRSGRPRRAALGPYLIHRPAAAQTPARFFSRASAGRRIDRAHQARRTSAEASRRARPVLRAAGSPRPRRGGGLAQTSRGGPEEVLLVFSIAVGSALHETRPPPAGQKSGR